MEPPAKGRCPGDSRPLNPTPGRAPASTRARPGMAVPRRRRTSGPASWRYRGGQVADGGRSAADEPSTSERNDDGAGIPRADASGGGRVAGPRKRLAAGGMSAPTFRTVIEPSRIHCAGRP